MKFRQFHLIRILEDFEAVTCPLDRYVSNYFREHKAIGSKDRAWISETLYTLIRWKGLIEYLCERPLTWEKRFERFTQLEIEKELSNSAIPLHIRLSFPKNLFQLLVSHYGEEKTQEICFALNERAPCTIRINPLKTTRKDLIDKWKGKFQIFPCTHSQWGITFSEKVHLFSLPEFKEGLFEVQDEASQLAAQLIQAKPGDKVLDYCSGSGGKTLAFAHCLKGKGQIFLYDIRPKALQEAKKRLNRAGIQNVQFCPSRDFLKKYHLGAMQWIFLDVPCSGSGTLRRNPDQKWKFQIQFLDELIEKQRAIFKEALEFLHPEGKIVYATCSILPEENQKQIDYFMKTYDFECLSPPFFTLPTTGGMDGFFAVVLKKRTCYSSIKNLL